MSKYIPGNQKHLTLNDRIYTENELAKGTSFKDIATFLCKDPTTISKEVRAHRISDWYHKGTFYNSKNFCIHRYHCKVCFFLFTFPFVFVSASIKCCIDNLPSEMLTLFSFGIPSFPQF